MSTVHKSQRLQEVHTAALLEFDEIQSALRDERMQCLSDRRFYSIAGAQWEGPLGEQFENKPKFEMNKVHLSVIRIISEYRNNRIAVDFTPKDGTTGDKLADTCDGLYRADEQDSSANEAYDNAFEEAVGGGFGAWRLRACYEDEDDDENERQRVRFEPIFDADSSVFFNLDARRKDKADAKRCYVLTPMTRASCIDEYGEDAVTWDRSINQTMFDWCTPDVVYVCELYKVEEHTEVIHIFRGLDDQDMRVPAEELEGEEGEAKLSVLLATGFREVRQKRVKRRRVHKYILSGAKVLRDEGVIAGRCIPIVPTYGKRWYVDGVERCMGHVRIAKDAQRLANMVRSYLGEIVARGGFSKPIFAPEQMAGHTNMWANDAVDNFPYLLANPIKDAEGNMVAGPAPLAYTKAPEIPQALAALLQITEQDLMELLGNAQAGEKMVSNIAEKTVELIQQKLDMQTFIYMSNHADAVKRSGEIWLSMQKDIAVEEGRRMKSVSPQGEVSSVEVNVPAYDPDKGQEFVENDLANASLDVSVEVGPSSASKRSATVRALTAMKLNTQDPETAAVLDAMIMMNFDGEGISEARDFFRKRLVSMGVVKPTDEEAAELAAAQQNAKPSANDQYLQAAAEEATAGAASKRADTVRTIADANLKQAQTAKTVAETAGAQQDLEIAGSQALASLLDAGAITPAAAVAPPPADIPRPPDMPSGPGF